MTEFHYSEMHSGPAGNTFSQPYFQMWVDLDNDGLADDRLTFEPFFQQGYPGIAGKTAKNANHTWATQNGITGAGVPANTWFEWDLLNGAWYFDTLGVGGAFNELVTLPGLVADFGANVKIVSGNTIAANQGFFHVQDGFNSYDAYTGYVDKVSITTGGGNTAWDFEPASAPIPEPNTFVLFAMGGLTLPLLRRRLRR